MDYWQRFIGVLDAVLFGGMGAAVAYQFKAKIPSLPKLTIWEALWSFAIFVVSGGVIAGCTSDQLLKAFSIDPTAAGSISFLAGAIGGSILAAILKAIQEMDIWPFIKSLIKAAWYAKFGIKDKQPDDQQ